MGPAQATANLHQRGDSRQAWAFGGFTLAGLTGDLRPVFAYHGGDRQVTLAASGARLDAYQVGGALYVAVPLVGVVSADDSELLAALARVLFATPDALLAALVPPDASYTVAGQRDRRRSASDPLCRGGGPGRPRARRSGAGRAAWRRDDDRLGRRRVGLPAGPGRADRRPGGGHHGHRTPRGDGRRADARDRRAAVGVAARVQGSGRDPNPPRRGVRPA